MACHERERLIPGRAFGRDADERGQRQRPAHTLARRVQVDQAAAGQQQHLAGLVLDEVRDLASAAYI